MDPRRQDFLGSLGLLALRIGFGGFMLSHGWGKLQLLLDGKGSEFADPIGLGGTFSLIGAVMGEFVGALFVIFGIATRLAAIPTAFTMAVAAFIVHAKDPWSMEKAAERFFSGETQFPVAKEFAILYMTAFLALALLGAGRFSFDGWILPRLMSRVPTKDAPAG